jgi:hypothetical protein
MRIDHALHAAKPVEVMVVGVFHMSNPGRDILGVEYNWARTDTNEERVHERLSF